MECQELPGDNKQRSVCYIQAKSASARTLDLPGLFLWHLIQLAFPTMYCINGIPAIQILLRLQRRLLLSSITSREREDYGSVGHIKAMDSMRIV